MLRGNRSKVKTVNTAGEPCSTSSLKASSSSNDSDVGKEARSKVDNPESTKGSEAKAETFTSSANLTSDAAPTSWGQARAAVVAAVLAMLLFG
ncbi:hypothetical protein ON010_g18759 [Phytophthora cinnamomi]|nr:hypothetical protein ON010_g18759 [Phytophthora cinnamomi]